MVGSTPPLPLSAGANAAQLTTKYVTDPLMGGTSIHSNFVTFVKEA